MTALAAVRGSTTCAWEREVVRGYVRGSDNGVRTPVAEGSVNVALRTHLASAIAKISFAVSARR